MHGGVEGPGKKAPPAPKSEPVLEKKLADTADAEPKKDDYIDCTPKIAGYCDYTAQKSVLGTPNTKALLHHDIEIIEDEPTIKCLVCEIEDGARTLASNLFENGISANGPFAGLEMLVKKT